MDSFQTIVLVFLIMIYAFLVLILCSLMIIINLLKKDIKKSKYIKLND